MNRQEKIDLIKQRLNVTDYQAFKLLEDNEGDLVKVLIEYEKKSSEDEDRLKDLMAKAKQIIKKGNICKLIVKDKEKGKTLVEIPIVAGIAAFAFFPYMSILAALTVMYKEYSLEIKKIPVEMGRKK